jgi:hypothetical protein
MGKFQTQKLSYDRKRCGNLLEIIFVLQFCKILNFNGRASATKVKKKDKIVDFFLYFGDFLKVECLCLFDVHSR